MNVSRLVAIGMAFAGLWTGLCSFSPVKYSKDAEGVTVPLDASAATGGSRQVRLQVVDDKIVRVTATPEAEFSTDPSLVTVARAGRTPFKVSETDSTVSVTTSALTAVVDRRTGQVTFLDLTGRVILAEEAGGRSYKPVTVEGMKGYSVRQTWESPDDEEGIYGLGQHQSDEFNYKGKNEELFQYNTKVSVPFVVSTGNYGVLWDSYSLCRWGNPEPYSQLGRVLDIYDRDGRPGALTGIYTAKGETEPRIVQREDSIYFEHLERDGLKYVVNLPKEFEYNGSHVVYEGEIEAPESGEYKMILYYSGYVTVTVDGKEVVAERWRTSWNPNAYKFSLDLEKGKRVPLKIDWHPDGGVAYLGLRGYAPCDEAEQGKMSWWGEMQPETDYYFIAGDDMDDVIHGYRTLTGKAPVMAKWVMGYWQSREKYNTQKEVLGTLAEFRKRRIPIDNIVIDWLHWEQDQWGSHEFDRKRFPDPKGMVDSIHAMNGRVMISVWPKFYINTEHYKEFDSRGWMYRLPVQDSIKDWVGPGYVASFYDAYHPEARKLFWHQMEDHYYPLGIDAWWMDASEPNIRDCTDMQYRKDLITPTALGPSTRYFNAYGLMNAQAIYEGQRATEPDRRVFLLTRSGFAGQQRYSTATWSGDIATRWEDMKAQISAGLNFAAAGIPYWSQDIGGFCVENRYVRATKEWDKTGKESDDLREWRELNTRWYQMGAFTPLFRSHGQWPKREVFNLAPENHPAYESITYYTQLRYDLMPYIYSLAGLTWLDDYTIMRPMVMDFGREKELRDVGDQYMFGPALLVAPVYTYGARSRRVVLPSGGKVWYDFYTERPESGGRTIEADAPYERMPLFVRSGSIIPFGPRMQWSDEVTPELIELRVYAGEDGEFTIYEDNGLDYNYEKGEYALIPLHWDDENSSLTIDERQGGYPGMLVNRRFKVRKAGSDKVTEVTYDGTKQVVKI